MSRISDLRNNENNCVNIVKILELFCKGETKYIEMLVKLFPSNGDSIEIKVNAISTRTGIDVEKIKQLNANEIQVLYYMVDNMMLLNSIKFFNRFCELNEQKQIEKNDLHSYKTFDEVENSVSDAEEKIRIRELEKQINKIYEDEEWLLLIPLTYEASVKYGYNTKWCTASETTSQQYNSYTKDGILIYIIHKGVEKIAVYKKYYDSEVSFWNQTDKKRDSFEFNFPEKIMGIIRETISNNSKEVTNLVSIDDYLTANSLLINSINSISYRGIGVSSSEGKDIRLMGGIDPIHKEIKITGVAGTSASNDTHVWSKTGDLSHPNSGSLKSAEWGSESEMRKMALEKSILEKKTYSSSINSPDFVNKVKDIMSKLR